MDWWLRLIEIILVEIVTDYIGLPLRLDARLKSFLYKQEMVFLLKKNPTKLK